MSGDSVKPIAPPDRHPDVPEDPSTEPHGEAFAKAVADCQQPVLPPDTGTTSPPPQEETATTAHFPDHAGVRFEQPNPPGGTTDKRPEESAASPPQRAASKRPAPHFTEQYWKDSDQAPTGDDAAVIPPRVIH
jgi:hypothetical protein